MVDAGQFVGPGAVITAGVQDAGEQDDQFTGAVALAVGDVVLDHPGQVGHGQATLVEGVRHGVDVVQVQSVAGRGEQSFPAAATDRRLDQDVQ